MDAKTWLEERKELEAELGEWIAYSSRSEVAHRRAKRTYHKLNPCAETGRLFERIEQSEQGGTIETLPVYGLFPLLCLKSVNRKLLKLFEFAPLSEVEITNEENGNSIFVPLYDGFVLSAILWPEEMPCVTSEVLLQLYSGNPDWALQYISEMRAVYSRRSKFAHDFLAMVFSETELENGGGVKFHMEKITPKVIKKDVSKLRDKLKKALIQMVK